MQHVGEKVVSIYYYRNSVDDSVFAKRGNVSDRRDIYLYRPDEQRWHKFKKSDELWQDFLNDLFWNCRGIDKEELKHEGVPLLTGEETLPDKTKEYYDNYDGRST